MNETNVLRVLRGVQMKITSDMFEDFERTTALQSLLLTGFASMQIVSVAEKKQFKKSKLFLVHSSYVELVEFNKEDCLAVLEEFNIVDAAVRSLLILVGINPKDDLVKKVVSHVRNGRSFYSIVGDIVAHDRGDEHEVAVYFTKLKDGYNGALGSSRSRVFILLWLMFGFDSFYGYSIEKFMATVGVGLFALCEIRRINVERENQYVAFIPVVIDALITDKEIAEEWLSERVVDLLRYLDDCTC